MKFPFTPSHPSQRSALLFSRLGTAAILLCLASADFSAAETTTGKPQQLTSPDQTPEGLEKSDWASIHAAHEGWKHQFNPVEGGWQARNPGQQWNTRFDGRGFITTPDGANWTWGMEFQSYGFGENLTAITGTPEVRASGQRLSYHWNANVEEWFINDQRGLEHGFIVKERPQGAEAGAPLAFIMSATGSLMPSVSADSQTVHFRDAAGAPVLNYSGLKVWDAEGTILTSRFERGADNTFRLLVEESTARYPITIDPIAQQAYLKASNTDANDQFGYSVAISGDTVVIGAPYEDSNATTVNGDGTNNSASSAGAAYVFVRSEGSWSQQAYLKASNTSDVASFGYSVSVSGDTVVVGAYRESSNGSLGSSGAAYVFVRSGSNWSQQAYLKASNAGASDQFGFSVAVSGNTVVVGAIQEDSSTTGVNSTSNNSSADSGAAYVFVRSGTTWSQQAYLKASNTGAADLFGLAVAISGDTVIVGATGEDSSTTGVNSTPDENQPDIGAAYIFVRNGSTWSQQAYLKASNTWARNFGGSVSVSGSTVVVGASLESSSTMGVNSTPNFGASGSGAAYVFVRNGSTWSQQAYLKASNTEAGDYFGSSVAVSGDTVVVGAGGEDSSTTGVNSTPNEGASDSGAAYVFVRSGTTWSQRDYLKASNTGAGDIFGASVAVSGDTVVVGAGGEDSSTTEIDSTPNESAAQSGAAYVFAVENRLAQTLNFPPIGNQSMDNPNLILTAAASSTLPITFKVVSGPATVNGNTLTLTGVGTVVMRATQVGDPSYAPVSAEQSFTVLGASQTITFPVIGNQALAENTMVALNATVSSNLPITYTVMSGPAWVNGSTLTLYGVGTVVVRASQAGNADFIPASSVNQIFSVSLGAPPAAVAAHFTSAGTVPVTATNYVAAEGTIQLSLGYAPATGTDLTVVRNTGLGFITGTFSNLAQGQAVSLSYGGATYRFVADYYGGSGNDLTLRWADKRLLAWGYNLSGKLGNNGTSNQRIPTPVFVSSALAGKTVTSITPGSIHSIALCSDGTLAAWGHGSSGELGNNSSADSLIPIAVSLSGALAGKSVVSTSAGTRFSLALCSDGTVAAWGGGMSGQLGNNNAANSLVPVAVTTSGVLAGKTVVAISAGGSHSLALCSDGTLVAWGGNDQGQLGINSTTFSSVPVAVSTTGVLAGKSIVAISAGGSHSLALCSDGTVAAWGRNFDGQLGNASNANSLVPVAVSATGVLAGRTVVAIAAGGNHSLALSTDGVVTAWGDGSAGNLGNNNNSDSLVPVTVSTSGVLAGKIITAVSAGDGHSLALCSDGTLAAWGRNIEGQVGDNSTTSRLSPVLVSTAPLTAGERFSEMKGGGYSTFGLVAVPVPMAQTITFTPIGNRLMSNPSVSLSATASSNLPVTFNVVSGPASLSGTTLTLTGEGAVVVRASQAGNTAFAPASVEQSFSVSRVSQTINFGVISDRLLSDGTIVGLGATASSGLTVTFSLVSGPATLSGSFLTLTGYGTVTVRAQQAGNAVYQAATPVERSFTIRRPSQTITFAPIPDRVLTEASTFQLSATASSGLPVSFVHVSGPATISGNLLTLTGAGLVTVYAIQDGNADFEPANSVIRSFTASKANQTINFSPLADLLLKDGTSVNLSATSSSGLIVTYSVVSGPAAISGNSIILQDAGTVTVRASQAGNFAYAPALAVERSFTASKSSQNITFAAISDRLLKDGTSVNLSAITSSGLPVSYNVVSGPATLSGSTLNLTGPGIVTVRASQAGNFAYTAATPVERSFTVSQSSQEITFPALANRFLKDGTTVTLSASTPSGLPITFTLVSGPATLSGSTLTLTGTGTVTVRASQAGNFAYTAATPVERSFTVSQSSQEISFPALSDRLFRSGLTIPLQATSSSGLAVSYSIVSGPGSLTGSNLAIQSAGTIVVRASQAGSFAYLPAPSVERTVVITPNTAPTNLTLSKNWFYDNAPTNTEIGTLSVTDPDVGDVISYSFVTGTGSTDNAKFSLSGNSLRKASTAFNYNTQRTASIRIRATDLAGQFHEQAISLNLVAGSPNAKFIAAGDSFTQAPSYVNAVFQLVNKSTERGINYPRALFDPSSPDYQPDLFQIFEAATIGGTASRITPNESFFQVGKISDVPSKVRTIILLDNSSSISIADLGVIRAAAKVMVDNMFDEQEIAIYTFSGTHALVQGFLGKSPANQAQLKAAIDTIGRGSATTNLYGSMLAMLNVPEWTESFSTAGINTGFLVALTDGTDSSGSATKEQVIAKRNLDGKKIYTIGLGANVDPLILQELQNTNFYTSATNASVLAAAFENIQKDIIDLANSYYRINYISPKRLSNPPGTLRKMEVRLKDNTNTALDSKLITAFNSDSFTDLEPTMFLNRTLDKLNGINPPEALEIDANAPSSASAITIFPPLDFSSFTWSIGNTDLATLTPQGVNGERVIITPNGQNGTTTLTLTDTISNTVGNFTKTIQLIIGTGVTLPPQTITFPTIADRVPTSPAFAIFASASSLLPVSFTLVSGPAIVSGNTVTLTGTAGTVTIRASQAGDASYAAAAPVTRSFTVAASSVLLASAIQDSGLTGDDALPNATPFNDGVENLLKYAFNMNLAGPDASTLPPGTGTSGLPSITTPEDAPAGTLRFEFLRRKGSGLVYAPRKSTTLDGSNWSPLAATPVVTSIDDQWERVVYTEAPDPVPAPACFGRVEVTAP